MATPIPQNRARFALEAVLGVTAGRLWLPAGVAAPQAVVGVTSDSRAVEAGALFVALTGDRFDGHGFLSMAKSRGASLALVARPCPVAIPQVVVASPLIALGELARHHRQRWCKSGTRTSVAIVGSAGKTTTRAATSALLSERFGAGAVHATPGNLNNRIGVPYVLLGLSSEHRYAVLELGTNRVGEVALLRRLVAPDVAVLTLIELEHSEGLGGLDGIEREEGSALLDVKLAIGNGDDARVRRQLRRAGAHLSYGFGERCDYRARALTVNADGRTTFEVARPTGVALRVAAPRPGKPVVYAALAALAVAEYCSGSALSAAELEASLCAESAQQAGRLKLVRLAGGVLVLDDSYNANPASMRAAIETARELTLQRGGRLHLVLGEMRELGSFEAMAHASLRAQIEAALPHSVFAVGPAAVGYLQPHRSRRHWIAEPCDALEPLLGELAPGDVVLVKGSRGVQTERLVKELTRLKGIQV